MCLVNGPAANAHGLRRKLRLRTAKLTADVDAVTMIWSQIFPQPSRNAATIRAESKTMWRTSRVGGVGAAYVFSEWASR